MLAVDVGKMFALLQEAEYPDLAPHVWSLWLYDDGSGHVGENPSDIRYTIAHLAFEDLSADRYVVMLWPLFLKYVESHRKAWGNGEYYVLGLSKRGAVQIRDGRYLDGTTYLLHEWPNLNTACSWLETWKNGAAL